jgi:hypothetical protein
MSDPFAETVGDALTTVRLVPRWTLPSHHWDGVAEALKALESAFRSGNRKVVLKAAENLDSLYPPTRLSAIPHGPAAAPRREPPPPEVMELVNTLIHPSSGWSTAAGSTPDPSSGR